MLSCATRVPWVYFDCTFHHLFPPTRLQLSTSPTLQSALICPVTLAVTNYKPGNSELLIFARSQLSALNTQPPPPLPPPFYPYHPYQKSPTNCSSLSYDGTGSPPDPYHYPYTRIPKLPNRPRPRPRISPS